MKDDAICDAECRGSAACECFHCNEVREDERRKVRARITLLEEVAKAAEYALWRFGGDYAARFEPLVEALATLNDSRPKSPTK